MSKIQNVIFDIGNVLVRWDPRYLYEKLIKDPEQLDRFLSDTVTLEWHTAHDAGLPMAEGVRRLSAKFPQYADLIDCFRTRWQETIGAVIEDSVSLLNTLHDNQVPLYALTNFSAETFLEFKERHSFMAAFHNILVSGEVGMVKPDPRIFQLAKTRFQVTPETTLFIDDRIDNCSTAQALGFQTHHFDDPKKLKADLIDRGLL